jgi:hypothetical protein
MLVVAVAVSASCATIPAPIPVSGTTPGLTALSGRWSGDYWSPMTGRHGSIEFTLAVDADTAFGEVLMVPRHRSRNRQSDEVAVSSAPPSPRPLNIRFVRATSDSVSGMLAPYEDPECGCLLITRFVGRFAGGSIEGRYETLNTRTLETTSGTWNVHRER